VGEDVEAVIDRLDALHDGDGRTPLYGVGHSMGGAALVLAELARPGRFAGLWLYEPIVFPPFEGVRPRTNPMASAARRRKAWFPDKAAALENYASKPPLGALHPDALAAYVDHGFRESEDGGVELKCSPETEGRIFEGGSGHKAFAGLGEIACPLIVAAGGDGQPPAQVAPIVADAARFGHLDRFPQLSHFGPMEDPEAIAEFIRRDLDLG
jgi:pimeloyl-ACP methyl ester carboxylesterase